MYGFRSSPSIVRDPVPPYGAGSADRYPADDVLADLDRVTDGAAAGRILARYAALRLWLLRQEGGPAEVTRHAEEAARAHVRTQLQAESGAWPEGDLLHRLLSAGDEEAAVLLAAAGRAAASAGHRSGARALRRAARNAAARRGPGRVDDPPPPSE